MGTETISKLLEKLDKQQYTDVIRSFSQHNKRLKIPGFTLVERAPLKLVANTARTNKIFRKALFQFFFDLGLSLTKDIFEDLLAGFGIGSGGKPTFPTAIFPLADVALAVGSALCHNITSFRSAHITTLICK